MTTERIGPMQKRPRSPVSGKRRETDPRVRAHVNDALALIQKAQDCIRAAAERLSPIMGMSKDHQRLMREHDRIRDAWYALDARRDAGLGIDNIHADSKYPCASCLSAKPLPTGERGDTRGAR